MCSVDRIQTKTFATNIDIFNTYNRELLYLFLLYGIVYMDSYGHTIWDSLHINL